MTAELHPVLWSTPGNELAVTAMTLYKEKNRLPD